MKLLKNLTLKNLRMKFYRDTSSLQPVQQQQKYMENITKHRIIMNLYDLSPEIYHSSFIAPNATIIGEVVVGMESAVWYGTVIRGDINAVRIGSRTQIGDNTVIHTAASLPTGIPASVNIGSLVNIRSNCTLYSCTIEDEVLVGFKSVILEGAKLEKGCAIGPNSVVPPGRLIPSGQLWAGNPVEYIRDLTVAETAANNDVCVRIISQQMKHRYEFLPYNNAYLLKENIDSDLNVSNEEIASGGKIPHEYAQSQKTPFY